VRTRLSFALVFLAAVGVQAQPCTPMATQPFPWPKDRPHREVQSEEVTGFYYAGGLYFASYHESPLNDYGDFSAVGSSVDDLSLIELSAGMGTRDAELNLPPFYLRGWYYDAVDIFVRLVRSHDGMHWQALSATTTGFNHPINWTGEQFVVTGEFGDVWTSPSGEQWTYRAHVPNVFRPMFTGLADRYRLVVGGTEFRGYTEDYEHWHLEEVLVGPSCLVCDVIGNGWFFAGERTRDGKTWLPEVYAIPGLWGGNPDYIFFAGREFLGPMSIGGTPKLPAAIELHLFTTPDGSQWKDRLIATLTYEPGKLNLTDYFGENWDGKRVWWVLRRSSPFEGEVHPISEFFLASTSCADLGDPVMLPAVSHADGANGTQWRTSLALHYPGPGAGEALVQWLPFGQANPTPQEKRVFFSTGESVEFADVVADLFGASGSGSLRVTSVGPAVVASARTYNDTADGTLGQEIAPWRWDDGIGKDEEGWLAGLSDSGDLASGFRTNVGVQNLWVNEVEVEVVFRDAQARELGHRRALLKAFEGVQWYRPLKDSPAGIASALVRILQGDSRVAAYASRIDNRSGDGSTIRAWKLPWQGTVR